MPYARGCQHGTHALVVACDFAMREPGSPRGDRPPHRVLWELWQPGHVMRCEMNAHPLGHEIRIYQCDEFQSAQVFAATEDAEREADDHRRAFTAAGWTERPPMPD